MTTLIKCVICQQMKPYNLFEYGSGNVCRKCSNASNKAGRNYKPRAAPVIDLILADKFILRKPQAG